MMSKDMSNSRGTELDFDKCLDASGTDRFSMILIAAARAREIKRKNMHSVRREHIFPTVTALLEIQEGKVGKEYLKKI
jgi:DNA-directed RNA polymerase omega subunit